MQRRKKIYWEWGEKNQSIYNDSKLKQMLLSTGRLENWLKRKTLKWPMIQSDIEALLLKKKKVKRREGVPFGGWAVKRKTVGVENLQSRKEKNKQNNGGLNNCFHHHKNKQTQHRLSVKETELCYTGKRERSWTQYPINYLNCTKWIN